MGDQNPTSMTPPNARALPQMLARYREPNRTRSIVELAITAGPLVLLWIVMWATLDVGYWLCLLLAVPAAGFLVRLPAVLRDHPELGELGRLTFIERASSAWARPVGRAAAAADLVPRPAPPSGGSG